MENNTEQHGSAECVINLEKRLRTKLRAIAILFCTDGSTYFSVLPEGKSMLYRKIKPVAWRAFLLAGLPNKIQIPCKI